MEPATGPDSFSIVRGGLVYRLLMRLRLETPGSLCAVRRAVVFATVAWTPLLVLNLVAPPGPRHAIPFVEDFAAYGRLLIVLPLLIVCEPMVEAWLAPTALNLVNGKLVADEDRGRAMDALESMRRLRDSAIADILLIALALGLTVWAFLRDVSGRPANWMSSGPTHLIGMTPAGWWFLLISGPILQYIYCRWIWRFLIWARLLWKVSRLNLRLVCTHGDSAGGLGHIGFVHVAFVPVVVASSTAVASYLANKIVHEREPLAILNMPIVVLTVVTLVVLLTPLLFFTGQLMAAKRRDMMRYGELGLAYTQDFGHKWLPGGRVRQVELLGTSDIQSLADLARGVEIVYTMRVVPFRLTLALILAGAAALPVLSLYLFRVPWKQALAILFRLLAGSAG